MSSASGTERSDVERGVLDSSAILAWLLNEPGCDQVKSFLPALVSAVNLTEVVYTAVRRGLQVEEVRAVIAELPLNIVPFDAEQIYTAAQLHTRTRPFGLSLADCVCLNLAAMRSLPALTTDKQWSAAATELDVRLIR